MRGSFIWMQNVSHYLFCGCACTKAAITWSVKSWNLVTTHSVGITQSRMDTFAIPPQGLLRLKPSGRRVSLLPCAKPRNLDCCQETNDAQSAITWEAWLRTKMTEPLTEIRWSALHGPSYGNASDFLWLSFSQNVSLCLLWTFNMSTLFQNTKSMLTAQCTCLVLILYDDQ